jgi:hypothetical protein
MEIEIEQYGKELYSRKEEAIILSWADCGDEGWKPREKECHLNVTELCLMNADLQPARGWLMFDLVATNLVKFVAHSVVKNIDGKYYDITPPNIDNRPPFILAKDSEVDFEKIVIQVGDFIYASS